MTYHGSVVGLGDGGGGGGRDGSLRLIGKGEGLGEDMEGVGGGRSGWRSEELS